MSQQNKIKRIFCLIISLVVICSSFFFLSNLDDKATTIQDAQAQTFSGGLITGLVGVGGGTADTTSMVLLGMDPKKAAATSEFAMASTAFFGFFVHFLIGTYTGSLLWPIFMCIGTVIGAQIGSYLSTRLDSNIIRRILACVAAYTGFLLILLMFGIGWTI